MILTPGPKRLILIRAGSYDYAEVALGSSTHLVGPNNVGKTSLIATVQFLYVADFKEMRFSRPWEESQRYYFASDESTILFETATADGRFVTLGLRGRGQVGSYQVDRFAYEGQYRREDFLFEDSRVRPFAEVKASLVTREFHVLTPTEIRSAVAGELQGELKALNMAIVPLKNPGRYGDFVYLLKNLLRLSHLSQTDIKNTLISVFRHDIKHAIEIDLHREYADQYAALTAERAKLDSLRTVSQLAGSLRQNRDHRDLARRDLPALYQALIGAKSRAVTDLEKSLKALDSDNERLREEENGEAARKGTLEADNNKISRDLALGDAWIGHVEDEGDALRHFLPEIAASERSNLEAKIGRLTGKLVTAGKPDVLEAKLDGLERELRRVREQRDKHATLLGTRLLDRLGPAVIADIGRVIHPEILRLPVESGAVEIDDEAKLVAALRQLHGQVRDGVLRTAGVSIPLGKVAAAESVVVADIATLNGRIDQLEREITATREDLDTARNMEALKEQLDGLKVELRQAEALAARHQQWMQDSAALPEKRREVLELRRRQKDNRDQRDQIQTLAVERANRRNENQRRRDGIVQQQRDLDRIRPVPVDATWLLGAIDPEWQGMAPAELYTLYGQTRDRYDNAEAEVSRVLQGAEVVYRDGFGGTSVDQRIDALVEAVETLKIREENFRRQLGSVITDMRAAFNNMFHALNALSDSVATINRSIARVAISNLQQLTLELVENTEVTRHYRSMSTSDMFDDVGKIEEAIKAIYAAIENTRILRLADWFGVRFVVTTADGKATRYDDLTAIESNGTTIAIKVLLNMVLIRQLMHGKRPSSIPFYIDEASQVDDANLAEIVSLANGMGFAPVLASTTPSAVAEHLDRVTRVAGHRAVIDPRWRITRHAKVEAHDAG